MKTQHNLWLTWFARLLAVAFVLFLALFALDVFGMYSSVWKTLVALFMHLIPNFVLLAALVVAWRWKMMGGIVFLILGVVTIFAFNTTEHIITFLLVSLPVFVIGALFIMDGMLDRRETSHA